jgi:hypothetical protein
MLGGMSLGSEYAPDCIPPMTLLCLRWLIGAAALPGATMMVRAPWVRREDFCGQAVALRVEG